jgi:hypothetical protein
MYVCNENGAVRSTEFVFALEIGELPMIGFTCKCVQNVT